MKNKVLLLLAVLPFLITILLLRMVPDEIPMHYDFSGNINRWGSKFELLLFPVFIAVFQVFWVLLLSSFARKRLASCDEKLIAGSLQNEKSFLYCYWHLDLIYGLTLLYNDFFNPHCSR